MDDDHPHRDEPLTTIGDNGSDAPCPVSGPAENVGTPSGAEWVTALTRLEEATQGGFAELRATFEQKLAFDRFKEEQISRLHAELQSYKGDLIAEIRQPFVRGLVRLHDDLGKTVAALARRPSEEQTPERFLSAFAGFANDLELLLGQHGIERFESSGESFDPRRQTALRTEPTSEPEKAGTVAARLRPGFEQGEKLFQKERVAVYAAAKAAAPEPTARGSENLTESETE